MDSKIKFKNRDPNDFINQKLAESFRDGPDFDVDLVLANNRIVSAHRVVLSMFSKFFRSVLSQSEPDTKFIVPLPKITNVVMEKVIEFFYYGEFEANAPLQKKVMDTLKFLEVDDLLVPAPPKPKPMPTLPINQPNPVPTTTQPKSMAPTTQPKSIHSTTLPKPMPPNTLPKSMPSTTLPKPMPPNTLPKPMPPTTQSKPVASNMTSTQANVTKAIQNKPEQMSNIQTQQKGDILRPNNNQIAQQHTNPIVTKAGNAVSAEKSAGTDVDATTNAIVAEPTDDEMNQHSKNSASHQIAEKMVISNMEPALEELSDENSLVSTADVTEKDAPLFDMNNNISMFDGKFGASALNCDVDDDDDKWLEKQAQELFDL